MQRNATPRPAKRFWRSTLAGRAALLATTGLSALLLLPRAAAAQTLAPDATPQGGAVAAGSAAITQAPGSTTINQSSARTVIDWQSFNVGSAASVQFNQPSASAIALNRVVTPSPSIIAGQINANGQLVLINQSGVVVTKGADINAESLVLATSNIATKDFMAGNMAFSGAPKPGAKIINDGNITVGETGLAGLVAPQVVNDGVITARLGQVVIAGASAFTLDLYGDRLISLDVTKAVRAVDVGGALVPALVTNRGLILADGGKITLTAQDADALVTQLIDAGGTLRADTVGGQAGTVSISGVGGDITIAGNLLARGGAGSSGGDVQALSTGTVSVAPAALIDTSGAAGGGIIALGTDLNRAVQGAADVDAPRAAAVRVAAGAQLHADATQAGNAGRVVLLSQNATDFQGLISVQGGPAGGAGGAAEISSGGVISLGGTVLDGALDGQSGEVLLDPATLAVTGGGASDAASASAAGATTFGDDSAGGISTLSAASLDSLGGTIVLEASSLISVGAAIGLTAASALTLASLGDITISAAVSLASGGLELDAADTLFVGGALTAGDISLRDPGTGGVTLAAPVSAASALQLQSGGDISEADGGFIIAPALSGTAAGAAGLSAGLNSVELLDGFTASSLNFRDSYGTEVITSALTAGSITLVTPNDLFIVAPVEATAGDVDLVVDGLGFGGTGHVTAPADAAIAYAPYLPTGIEFSSTLNALSGFSAGTLVLGAADGYEATEVEAAGNNSFAGALQLQASDNVLQEGTLSAGSITLVTPGTLSIFGPIVASSGDVDLVDAVLGFGGAGSVTAPADGTIALAPYLPAGIAFSSTLNALANFAAGTLVLGDADGHEAAEIVAAGNNSFAGTLLLRASADALQEGTLSAGNLDISAASIAIGGTITTPGFLNLSSPGTIVDGGVLNAATLAFDAEAFGQGANGTVAAGPLTALLLTGSAANFISLGNLDNAVSALGPITAGSGGLLLGDDAALTVNAPVQAQSISIADGEAGGIALGAHGSLLAAGGIALASDALSAAAGATFSAASVTLTPYADTGIDLGGTSAGMLDLAQAVFTAAAGTPTLQLGDGGASLATDGAILASAGTLLLDADAIGFNSALAASGVLTLESPGAVAETGQGGLTAPVLDSAGTLGAVGLTAPGNDITSLGSFSAASLALVDSTGLGVTGQLAAGNATLSAPGIAFNAAVEVPGTLALLSSAGISQSAAINAGTLTSGGAVDQGGVDLDENPNSIATLGAFSLGSGDFALQDAAPLRVTGPLTAPAASLLGTSLALAGDLRIDATLTLAGAAAQQVAGSIASQALDLALTGDAALAGQANTIASLGGFAGDVTLSDATALAIDGLTAGNIFLTAPALAFTGDAQASGILTLDSRGAISQSGGTVSAATLASAGAGLGSTALEQSGNAILNLGGVTASSFGLRDASALAITGPLDAGNATLAAAGIAFDGAADVPGNLSLGGTGGVSQTAAITAGTLSGALGGEAELGDAANHIGTLGNLALGGFTLSLDDAGALVIAGQVSAGEATLSAAGLDLTGSLLTAGATELASTAGISEAGTGTLAAASLGGSDSGGDVALNGVNSIASLGDFNAGAGMFALTDAAPLDVSGALGGATATLSAPSLTLDGGITAADALTLGAAGGVQQNAGGITAANLVLDTDGVADLAGNANSVGNLSGIASSVTLTDQEALGVSDLTAGAIALTAPAISLGAGIDASFLLGLASPGEITQTAALTAGTLSSNGATDGTVELTQTDNLIGTLGGFSAGSLSLADDLPLTVTGPVDANLLSLNGLGVFADLSASSTSPAAGNGNASARAVNAATQITTAPSIIFAGNVTAGTLAINAGGALGIDQTGGVITAGTLTTGSGNIDGDAVLAGANAISTLSNVTVLGALTLATETPLTLAGTIMTNDVIALLSDGLAIMGSVDTGELQIESGGDVAEGGAGVITTAALSTGAGSIAGSATFENPDNDVLGLDQFLAAGGLSLADRQSLALNDAIELGGTLTLSDPDSVMQYDGTLAAGGLATTGSGIGGALSLGLPGNAISTLGNLTVSGSASIADTVPLALAGAISVGGDGFTLADTGPITQTSGSLSTAVLNASASALSLADANLIGALGSVAVAGDLLVNGASSLAGPLTADNATLSSTGGLGLSGTASLAGALTLLAAGDITQTAGTLSAGSLSGAAGGAVALGGAGAVDQIGTLGSFTLQGNPFTLNDAGPLTLAGPLSASTVGLTASGQLLLDGSAGGGLNISGSLAGAGATLPPGATQSELAVLPGQDGTASLIETGSFAINGGQAATPATIFLVTGANANAAGGTISFDPATGLLAPGADVIFAAGRQGAVTGRVSVGQLEIYSAGTVNLTGSIAGISGGAAAAAGTALPAPAAQYQFNACEIGVVNCGLLPIEILQEAAKTTTTANPVNKLYTPILTANPLENFDISQSKRRRLNKNVQLPGIATHDF